MKGKTALLIFQSLASRLASILMASLLAFMILESSPGSVIDSLVGDEASQDQIATLERQLNLDKPLLSRYAEYMLHFIQGDFGTSLVRVRPVVELIGERFFNTLVLGFLSILLATFTGFGLGMLSAMKYQSWIDTGILVTVTIFLAVPAFSGAILLTQIFSINLGWLPVVGGGSVKHLILPTISLTIPTAAVISRLVRSRMIEELHQFYVITARAKGLSPKDIWQNHILRNALVPALTFIGIQTGHLLGGAVIIETLFAYPGIGRLIVQAVFDQDYPVVLTSVILIAVLFQILNGLVDILHRIIDPRVGESAPLL